MIEIKFQGRGGQGVMVASEILGRACFEEGLYPQCFSIFGGERRGAPVAAYVRVSEKKIYQKCEIERPNHLVLFAPDFKRDAGIADHVKDDGVILLNGEPDDVPHRPETLRVGAIHAQEISRNHGLGGIVNTTMLGAYVGFTQIVELGTLLKVIEKNVPAAVRENIHAAEEAYGRLCCGGIG